MGLTIASIPLIASFPFQLTAYKGAGFLSTSKYSRIPPFPLTPSRESDPDESDRVREDDISTRSFTRKLTIFIAEIATAVKLQLSASRAGRPGTRQPIDILQAFQLTPTHGRPIPDLIS